MKKHLSLLTIIILIITSLALTGCGSTSTSSDETLTPPEETSVSLADDMYVLKELCGYTEDEAFDKISALSYIDEGYYTYSTDDLFGLTGDVELICDYGEVVTASWRASFYSDTGKADGLEMYYDFIDAIEEEFPSAVGHDESYAEDYYTYVFNDNDINMSVNIMISDDETILSVACFE